MRWISVLTLILTTGCSLLSGQNAPSPLNPDTVRDKLKTNLTAAANAAEAGSLAAAKNPAWKNVTTMGSIRKAWAHTAPSTSAETTLTLAPQVSKLLDGGFGLELFNRANIQSKTEMEIIYLVQSTLCDQLAVTTGTTDGSDLPSKCKDFLSSNSVQIRVKSLENDTLEISLFFAEQNSVTSEPQLVASLLSSPTVLGGSGNLTNLKQFTTAVAKVLGDNNSLSSLKIDTLKGTISWQLQFPSKEQASDCKDGGKLCLTLNVDEDLLVNADAKGKFSLSLGASPKTEPTLYASLDDLNTVSATVNAGKIDASLVSDGIDASASNVLQLKGLGGRFSVPAILDGENASIVVQDFHLGQDSALLKWNTSTVTLDLNKDNGGKLAFGKLWVAANTVFTELSQLGLNAKIESKSQDCALIETLAIGNTVSSSNNDNSTFKFALPADNGENNTVTLVGATSTPDCAHRALLHGLSEAFSVSDTCQKPLELQADKGGFSLKYTLKANDADATSVDFDVSEGKCLAKN